MRLVHALAVALVLVDEATAWGWAAAVGEGGPRRKELPADGRDAALVQAELDPVQTTLRAVDDDPTSSASTHLDLPPDERQALFSSLHLLRSSSTSRPDCFRTVASQLRTRCTPSDVDGEQDEGGGGQDDRTDAAILLTLCDLASAQINPPSECTSYDPRLKGSHRPRWEESSRSSSRTTADRPDQDERRRSRSRCVESLSRSPQFWSSYSGYIREATQLCFALQRSRDVDRAHQIFVNATMEKVSLLQHLRRNERVFEAKLEDLSNLSSTISDLHRHIFDSESVASEVRDIFQTVWGTFEASLRGEVERGLHPILAKHHDLLVAREEASLDRVLANQEAEISAWVTSAMDSILYGSEWGRLKDGLHVLGQALSSRSLADLTSLAQTIANLTTVLQAQTELANRTSHLLEEQNRRLSLSGSSWLGWVAAVAWRVVGRGVLGMWGGITTSNNNAIELEGSYRSPSLIERLLETWLTSRVLGFVCSTTWLLVRHVFVGALSLAGISIAGTARGLARVNQQQLYATQDEEAQQIKAAKRLSSPPEALRASDLLASPMSLAPSVYVKSSPKSPTLPPLAPVGRRATPIHFSPLKLTIQNVATGDRSRRAMSSPCP